MSLARVLLCFVMRFERVQSSKTIDSMTLLKKSISKAIDSITLLKVRLQKLSTASQIWKLGFQREWQFQVFENSRSNSLGFWWSKWQHLDEVLNFWWAGSLAPGTYKTLKIKLSNGILVEIVRGDPFGGRENLILVKSWAGGPILEASGKQFWAFWWPGRGYVDLCMQNGFKWSFWWNPGGDPFWKLPGVLFGHFGEKWHQNA